jgi:hypothetical protein
MAKPRESLPLLAHLPRLEADGVTHRRDCECVRCDAGFRPTEHDRTVARQRWQVTRAQERRAGVPLTRALELVDRVGPAGFEPAAYGLKVRSSTS